jgi:general secretion pathway protein C
MLARWLALVVWALVAGTAVFWGLRLLTPAVPVPAQVTMAVPGIPAGGDLTRLFGVDPPPPVVLAPAAPPPPPESARFQLVGVAAAVPQAPRSGGVALIALDGKPARAYRVGAVIEGEHVLQDVQARTVSIGPRDGPALISLELPALPPAATGVPVAAAGAPAAPAPPLPPAAPPTAPVLLQPPTPGTPAQAAPLTIQPQPVVQGGMPLPGMSPTQAQVRMRVLRATGGTTHGLTPGATQLVPQTVPEGEAGGLDATRR